MEIKRNITLLSNSLNSSALTSGFDKTLFVDNAPKWTYTDENNNVLESSSAVTGWAMIDMDLKYLKNSESKLYSDEAKTKELTSDQYSAISTLTFGSNTYYWNNNTKKLFTDNTFSTELTSEQYAAITGSLSSNTGLTLYLNNGNLNLNLYSLSTPGDSDNSSNVPYTYDFYKAREQNTKFSNLTFTDENYYNYSVPMDENQKKTVLYINWLDNSNMRHVLYFKNSDSRLYHDSNFDNVLQAKSNSGETSGKESSGTGTGTSTSTSSPTSSFYNDDSVFMNNEYSKEVVVTMLGVNGRTYTENWYVKKKVNPTSGGLKLVSALQLIFNSDDGKQWRTIVSPYYNSLIKEPYPIKSLNLIKIKSSTSENFCTFGTVKDYYWYDSDKQFYLDSNLTNGPTVEIKNKQELTYTKDSTTTTVYAKRISTKGYSYKLYSDVDCLTEVATYPSNGDKLELNGLSSFYYNSEDQKFYEDSKFLQPYNKKLIGKFKIGQIEYYTEYDEKNENYKIYQLIAGPEKVCQYTKDIFNKISWKYMNSGYVNNYNNYISERVPYLLNMGNPNYIDQVQIMMDNLKDNYFDRYSLNSNFSAYEIFDTENSLVDQRNPRVSMYRKDYENQNKIYKVCLINDFQSHYKTNSEAKVSTKVDNIFGSYKNSNIIDNYSSKYTSPFIYKLTYANKKISITPITDQKSIYSSTDFKNINGIFGNGENHFTICIPFDYHGRIPAECLKQATWVKGKGWSDNTSNGIINDIPETSLPSLKKPIQISLIFRPVGKIDKTVSLERGTVDSTPEDSICLIEDKTGVEKDPIFDNKCFVHFSKETGAVYNYEEAGALLTCDNNTSQPSNNGYYKNRNTDIVKNYFTINGFKYIFTSQMEDEKTGEKYLYDQYVDIIPTYKNEYATEDITENSEFLIFEYPNNVPISK